MKKLFHRKSPYFRGVVILIISLLVSPVFNITIPIFKNDGVAIADVPGRPSPAGLAGTGTSVPNPGAQQQELPNITFPLPYNVFEFVVTCMACHGGTIDLQAGHGGNWAGTNMASSARDPVFRANQILMNNTIKNIGTGDGAGNMCWRCHSPNGWLSGRFDPKLGGSADGTDLIPSILLSTDGEGVSCEMCHRTIGGVTMKRPDLDPLDPVWNMLSGLYDWPHLGNPYPYGPGADNPYGEATLQYHDGMSYGGKYGGNMELFFSDRPANFVDPVSKALLPSHYTGQTYGIFPSWVQPGPPNFPPPPPGQPYTNLNGDVILWNYDGSLSFVGEFGVPPDPAWGATSPEHSTRVGEFIKTPEFCGACHDLTIPILNHGMPQQRTYTEWKYSAFGPNGTTPKRCQDCHMPTMKHEYADNAPYSLNPDPLVSGWYPYAKDRNISGGTTFHKLVGANRNLPKMMKILYPEVDLEVLGAPTGLDPRIFPGMLSDRSSMWERAKRNTELSLKEGVSIAITQAPIQIGTDAAGKGIYQVKVKVTNNTGHKLPSGFPDGSRMWIELIVKNGTLTVYRSGYYDSASAKLYNDSKKLGLDRALSPTIDKANGNAVMIYERKTGTCGATSCTMSFNIMNDKILFDNRIPPLGFTYADYSPNGAAFWNYDPATLLPFEDVGRYPDGQNWDEVTYIFTAKAGLTLSAKARVYHQTLPREFMDYLNTELNQLANTGDQGPRPVGPPNPMAANPILDVPLSDNILVTTGIPFAGMTDMNGTLLQDHWGGIAYAAWLKSGKGAPFLMASDDTSVIGPPSAPATVTVSQPLVGGMTDQNTQVVKWSPVTGADGYVVSIRYGADPLTSDWDKLAVLNGANSTSLRNVALNVAKTYVYRVQAFNGKGLGPYTESLPAQTSVDLPLPPINTKVTGTTESTVNLAWYDEADNEVGFLVQRQEMLADRSLTPWMTTSYVGSQTPGAAFGGNNWTDGLILPACGANLINTPPPQTGCYTAAWTPLKPNTNYNYRVAAYNAAGRSVFDLPVGALTTGIPPGAPTNLTARGLIVGGTAAIRLRWTDNATNEMGFLIQRSPDPKRFPWTDLATIGPRNVTTVTYTDSTVLENTTYHYQVRAFNIGGSSVFSNTAFAMAPIAPPAAPTNLGVISTTPNSVTLGWTDNSVNETGFEIWMASTPDLPSSWINVATVGPDVTTATVTDLAPGVTYWFEVRAVNAAGASTFAGPISAIPQ